MAMHHAPALLDDVSLTSAPDNLGFNNKFGIRENELNWFNLIIKINHTYQLNLSDNNVD